MKVINFFLITLFTIFSLKTLTIEEDNFKKAVNEGYQKYTYYLDEKDTLGDLLIVLGKVNNKNTLSVFYYQNDDNTIRINIASSNNKISVKATSTARTAYIYNVSLEKISEEGINIAFVYENSESEFKKIALSKATIEEAITKAELNGQGTNKFPKSTTIINNYFKYLILLLISLSVMIALGVGAGIVLAKVFRKNILPRTVSPQTYININDYKTIDDENNVDAEDEKQKAVSSDLNSQATFNDTSYETEEDIYKAYKAGLIDERELTARLRGVYHDEEDKH